MPYNNSDGFSGIVGAFNILRIANEAAPKDYPASFEGIKDAVLDIKKEWGNIGYGEYPPGWRIDYDGSGNVIGGSWEITPTDGDLWFDQNQGRMMVWIGGAYYQTNGADVLTVVSDTAPSDEVTGGLWYQPITSSLFLWNGNAWIVVATNADTEYTTDNLQLANTTATTLSNVSSALGNVSAYTTGTTTQSNLNTWLGSAIGQLDTTLTTLETNKPTLFEGSATPTGAVSGDLWYNGSLLKIRSSSAWESVIDFTDNASTVTALTTSITSQNTANSNRFTAIEASVAAIDLSPFATSSELTSAENTLQSNINSLTTTVGDLSRFATASSVTSSVNGLDTRVTTLENATIDFSPYATITALNTAVTSLQTQISNSGTASTSYVDTEVAAVQALIPDISGKLDTTTFSAYQTTVSTSFLPTTGGTLTGNLAMNKSDTALPSFDFSGDANYARKIFKTKAYASTDNYSTFGTNTNHWEYAWEFAGNEDFCWKHGTQGKQFSITKEGATAKNLFIADFQTNTTNGRNVINVIDVKSKLNALDTDVTAAQQDIQDIKTNIAINTMNQIYYSDTTPSTTNLNNGDVWFDSVNLRLNVRHSNAWVYPDRVEDTALKGALLNAVNTSTDYSTLKSLLISALS
ncbi:hypothetical protein N8654_02000 [Synechococcus sp. AH-601-B19]|nr:hypothetical protein [Synechococcus sp. AH-601-B19]